jgi:hypothetical protein
MWGAGTRFLYKTLKGLEVAPIRLNEEGSRAGKFLPFRQECGSAMRFTAANSNENPGFGTWA